MVGQGDGYCEQKETKETKIVRRSLHPSPPTSDFRPPTSDLWIEGQLCYLLFKICFSGLRAPENLTALNGQVSNRGGYVSER